MIDQSLFLSTILISLIMIVIHFYYMEHHPYTNEGPVTSDTTQRLIHFRGHVDQPHSMLITQVCDQYQTISLLVKGIPESASRTLSNLINLHAVRGNIVDGVLDLETAMVGPLKYYGFIDPHDTHIIIDNIYHRHHITPKQQNKGPITNTYSLKAQWHSGTRLSEKIASVDGTVLATDSIFKNPGLLLTELDYLELPVITDPYHYDLSSFRVQVVPNKDPFAFNQQWIAEYPHAQHKLRIITYYYGPRYVSDYLMKTNGLFIEKHDFIQAITPVHQTCSGYVIIGREVPTRLELVAITIPFGYTLLIEPRAIHGDSNLIGLYLMAMTGNHSAMATADTVYLKNKDTGPLEIRFQNTTTPPILNLPKEDHPLITSNKMSLDALKQQEAQLIANISDPLIVNPVIYNISKTVS